MLETSTRTAVAGALGEIAVSAESAALSQGTTLLTMGVTVPAEITAAWAALTEPQALITWSPIVPERPLTEIGPAQSQESEDAAAVDARVIEVAAPHVLRHAWGESELLWELEEAADGGTRITLTQTFSDSVWVPMTAAGWHICFTVLVLGLRGERVGRVVGDDAAEVGFEALREAYASKLG